MRMQIAQHIGIQWEFMNCLIMRIRVIANIPRRIREPVAVRLKSKQRPDPRHNPFINRIMHISAQRYRRSGQYARNNRKLCSFLVMIRPVRKHGLHNGAA